MENTCAQMYAHATELFFNVSNFQHDSQISDTHITHSRTNTHIHIQCEK